MAAPLQGWLAVLLLVLAALVLSARSQAIDINPFSAMIRDKHNNVRRSIPNAANMRELQWSSTLASQAEGWARRCRYLRPPQSYQVGSNVYAETDKVVSFGDKRRAVHNALAEWSIEQPVYRYTRTCYSSRACSFAQMIMAEADKIGCAMSRCPSIVVRGETFFDVSLVVCFYVPPSSLMDGYPYMRGAPCSRCGSSGCNRGLCSGRRPYPTPSPFISSTANPPSDTLSSNERHYVMLVHNSVRGKERMADLNWSDYLADWAEYVIRCNIEYPGPRDTYVNFGRCALNEPLHKVVYDWADEGYDVNIKRETSCRTPHDAKLCNHHTVMMEPSLRRMGCATRVCGSRRQLTCIYDDVPAAYREGRGRPLGAYTRSRPAYYDHRRYRQDTRRRARQRRYHF